MAEQAASNRSKAAAGRASTGKAGLERAEQGSSWWSIPAAGVAYVQLAAQGGGWMRRAAESRAGQPRAEAEQEQSRAAASRAAQPRAEQSRTDRAEQAGLQQAEQGCRWHNRVVLTQAPYHCQHIRSPSTILLMTLSVCLCVYISRALYSGDQSFPLVGAFAYSVHKANTKRIKEEQDNAVVGAVISTVLCFALACGVCGCWVTGRSEFCTDMWHG